MTMAVDVVIVGAGATGGLAAKNLTDQGLSVVVLENGKRFQPPVDLTNSEANSKKIQWNEPRVYTGKHSVVPKAGIGVGGGTLTYLGVMPRFHKNDFKTYSTEGVGEDWPISYEDLAPYYDKVEKEFGVAGDCGPVPPEPYELPMPAHRMSWHAQVLAEGARKSGTRPFAPPIAINSMEYDGRPACIYCGWCGSGCPTDAKATSQNTYLAKAEKKGARVISEAFVHRVQYDPVQAKATGVLYKDADGNEHEIQARIVILAAHAIETPRLLLLSSCPSFPEGLANSSGTVGKYLLSHPTWMVFGTFDELVNAYKGIQMGQVMVQDFYQPNRHNDYARGYILLSYMMTPITYANLSGDFIGADYKEFLYDYPYTAAWWAHAEGLPNENNTVTLDPDVKDHRGLPVARLTTEWLENDIKLAAAARDKAAELMEASGARKIRIGLNYGAHAMGTCRMGDESASSVVNEYGQTHDINNLFICDTSVFVTGTGLNPTLTAMAIASRAADFIGEAVSKGEL
ncbi:GMC family oxidoreductase [Peribacillus deserti]|uniref:GMC family oxidoreductase n=1 Tax=Peribacillus deserti TaxID=673318 RepID=A0A2N5M556_9BACI|nr:GMC family oxidoreductase [Peribacillus deserti]PLT29403.1 GMC family oxidoreductase [Peribacillus deserti]